MTLEHIFRNLNDIRVFDMMTDFNDIDYPVSIDDILEILSYPQREIIQIEDSVRHLISQQILKIVLVPEETTTGCKDCKSGIPRKKGHEFHKIYEIKTVNDVKYYMDNNNCTRFLVSAVMQNSFNYAKCLNDKDEY